MSKDAALKSRFCQYLVPVSKMRHLHSCHATQRDNEVKIHLRGVVDLRLRAFSEKWHVEMNNSSIIHVINLNFAS